MESQNVFSTTNGGNLSTNALNGNIANIQPSDQQVFEDSLLATEINEEINGWLLRGIGYLAFTVILYVQLYYDLPMELLYMPLIVSNVYLIFCSARKARSSDISKY